MLLVFVAHIDDGYLRLVCHWLLSDLAQVSPVGTFLRLWRGFVKIVLGHSGLFFLFLLLDVLQLYFTEVGDLSKTAPWLHDLRRNPSVRVQFM